MESGSAHPDVFISHASEDDEEVARPLAAALRARGLAVWHDEDALRLGDGLRREIDGGLGTARFGVLVLSPSFFAKTWPQLELGALLARETAGGRKVLLPVRHHLTVAEVLRHSPLLADRLSVSTGQGIDRVADEILRALEPGRAGDAPAPSGKTGKVRPRPAALAAVLALAFLAVVVFFRPAARVVSPPKAPPPRVSGAPAPPRPVVAPAAAPKPRQPARAQGGGSAEAIDFSHELELRENQLGSSHGVTIKTGRIEIGSGPQPWVEVGASVSGTPEETRPYPEGSAIPLRGRGCEWLEVQVKDIRVAWPEGVSPEKLREMGDEMADRIAKRSVVLLVAGRCPE